MILSLDVFKGLILLLLLVLLTMFSLPGSKNNGALAAPVLISPATALAANGDASFSGTGEPGSQVQVVANGEVLGQTEVEEDGTWSLSTKLDNPEQTEIELQTLDANGEVVATSDPIELNVTDNTANTAGGEAANAESDSKTSADQAENASNDSQSADDEGASTESDSQTANNDADSAESDSQSADDEATNGDSESQSADDEAASGDSESQSADDEAASGDSESQSTDDEAASGDSESQSTDDEGASGDNDSQSTDDEGASGDSESQSADDEATNGDSESQSTDDEATNGDSESQSADDEAASGDSESQSADDEAASGDSEAEITLEVPTLFLTGIDLAGNEVTFIGTGAVGSDVELLVDGEIVGKGKIDQDGTWGLSVQLEQQDEVEIQVLMVRNNEVVAISEKIFLNLATSETVIDLPFLISPSQITTGETTFTGIGTADAQLQLVIDGQAVGQTQIEQDGTWSLSTQLDNAGEIEVQVQLIDAEGQVIVITEPITLTVTESAGE